MLRKERRTRHVWILYPELEVASLESLTAWAIGIPVSQSYCSKINLWLIPFYSFIQRLFFEWLLGARHCEWSSRYKAWGSVVFLAAVPDDRVQEAHHNIWYQLPSPKVNGVPHMPHWIYTQDEKNSLTFLKSVDVLKQCYYQCKISWKILQLSQKFTDPLCTYVTI